MKNEKAASNWRQCTKHRGKAFLVTVLLLGTVWPQCCVSQGLVYFNNFGTTSGITNGLTWQLADIGTRFQVALYFAQVGVLNESQFVQLGLPIGINNRPGFFVGGILTAPTAEYGGGGFFQVRVWESAYGSTYEEAVANPNPQDGRLALAGESGILALLTGRPDGIGPPPGSLVGAHAVVGKRLDDGILLTVVPEPSLLPFLLVGVEAVVLLSRRCGGKAKPFR